MGEQTAGASLPDPRLSHLLPQAHRKGSVNAQAGPDAAPRWIPSAPERRLGAGGRRLGPGNVFTPGVPGLRRWEAFHRLVPTHLPCPCGLRPRPVLFLRHVLTVSFHSLPVTPPPPHFSFCTFSSSFWCPGSQELRLGHLPLTFN